MISRSLGRHRRVICVGFWLVVLVVTQELLRSCLDVLCDCCDCLRVMVCIEARRFLGWSERFLVRCYSFAKELAMGAKAFLGSCNSVKCAF